MKRRSPRPATPPDATANAGPAGASRAEPSRPESGIGRPAPPLALPARPTLPPAVRAQSAGVAQLLRDWGADETLITAGLLHEPVAAGHLALDEVESRYGAEVAHLCRAYVEQVVAPTAEDRRGHEEALRRTRVYAAAYADPALALLCVAHMWHSVAFIHTTTGRRQAPTSLTTTPADVRRVLFPLLDMLGLREARDQLEAWPGAEWAPAPECARRPAAEVLAPLVARLEEALRPVAGMQVLVREFPLEARGTEKEERGDMPPQSFALQLLAPSVDGCYLALRLLHGLYRPIEGGFVDTVALCRANGHRGLQSAVVAPIDGFGARLNVEIATPAMDLVNRWGVAAFFFQRHCLALGDEVLDSAWDGAWWVGREARDAAIRSAAPGSLPPTVVVFSPLGELFTFARGSTAVDYAYGLHSNLAEQCERFVVNGEAVEPATVLRHLDLVELLHNPRAAGPTQAWLNGARTRKARTRIRRFLRRQSEGINNGQRILEARLQTLESFYGFHIPDHRVAEAVARGARNARLSTSDELLAEIAAGRAAADRYLHPLFAEEIVRRLELPRALGLRPHQVQLAQCCRPRPGDTIVGLPWSRNGQLLRLTVHKSDCASLKRQPSAAGTEAVALSWRLRAAERILEQIEMTARSDDRLMGEALEQLYAMIPAVRLFRTDGAARRGTARLRFSIEADSDDTVQELMDRLRRLPGREVSQVRRLALPPSEIESLSSDGVAAGNPYSRMPVHDPTMFFGRAAELQRINEWLHNNCSVIWLRGQKRVGKTSFMLHLRHHFWEPHQATCAFVDFQLLNNPVQANIFFEIARAVFADLEKDPRVLSLGQPDGAAFDADGPGSLLAWLRALHQRLGARRLVLLLDEFSRLTDLHLQGQMSADFFTQWRGFLMAADRFCTVITVMQQKTWEAMRERQQTPEAALRISLDDNPCWQLQELGEELQLRPFDADSARRLVAWPMQNFITLDAPAIDLVLDLTGGSPFLIQSFCNRLVAWLARNNKSGAGTDEIDSVAEEFMQPSENLFSHLLDLAPAVGLHMLVLPARLAEVGEGAFTFAALQAAKPGVAPEKLRAILNTLSASDVLVKGNADEWRFASRLFQRWLARNA